VSTAAFLLGLVAVVSSLLGLLAPRRPHSLSAITFFIGWLASDLAAFHAIAKLLVALVVLGTSGGFPSSALGAAGLITLAVSVAIDLVLVRRQRTATVALDAAVREVIPDAPSVRSEHIAWRTLARPFPTDASGVSITRDIAYGEHGRHRLDVFTPDDGRANCPVLLQIHGGAWFSGHKEQQGQPLMRHLARNGWVCVAINYRLSPTASFPDHLIDVKRALAWTRAHIAEFGGDPTTIAVTGGSAGGHLAALVGLTANVPRYQPGFEDVDTSVVACVPVYAVLDLVNTAGVRAGFTAKTYDHLMSRALMRTSLRDDLEGWSAASPLAQVKPGAPPFFVVQGSQDTLVWREEARHFVTAMRDAGNVTAYAEVPYAQHAFDILMTRRSIETVRAIAQFLDHAVASRQRSHDSDGGSHV
jgi:acetyl esterase/lipase